MGDNIAVAADRLDHLIDVRFGRGVDLEHARSARTLQGFQNDVAAMRLRERLDVGFMPADQRRGARLDREALEIELVDRLRQAVGIVEDDYAALGRLPPEQYADFGRPRHRLRIERGIAAQHQHIDFVHVELARLAANRAQFLEEFLAVAELLLGQEAAVDME